MDWIPEGFLSDELWYEDLGHVAIGLLGGPLVGWWREEAQLPPATDREPVMWMRRNKNILEYWSANRVRDMRRDSFGYVVGGTVQTLLLGVAAAVGFLT